MACKLSLHAVFIFLTLRPAFAVTPSGLHFLIGYQHYNCVSTLLVQL